MSFVNDILDGLCYMPEERRTDGIVTAKVLFSLLKAWQLDGTTKVQAKDCEYHFAVLKVLHDMISYLHRLSRHSTESRSPTIAELKSLCPEPGAPQTRRRSTDSQHALKLAQSLTDGNGALDTKVVDDSLRGTVAEVDSDSDNGDAAPEPGDIPAPRPVPTAAQLLERARAKPAVTNLGEKPKKPEGGGEPKKVEGGGKPKKAQGENDEAGTWNTAEPQTSTGWLTTKKRPATSSADEPATSKAKAPSDDETKLAEASEAAAAAAAPPPPILQAKAKEKSAAPKGIGGRVLQDPQEWAARHKHVLELIPKARIEVHVRARAFRVVKPVMTKEEGPQLPWGSDIAEAWEKIKIKATMKLQAEKEAAMQPKWAFVGSAPMLKLGMAVQGIDRDPNGRIVVDFNGKAIMLKHSDVFQVKVEGADPDRESTAAGSGLHSQAKDGDTALEMAKNIENLFYIEGGPNIARAAPEGKGAAALGNKVKVFNPKGHCDAWGAKASDWATLYRDCHGKLKEKVHGGFVSISPKLPTAALDCLRPGPRDAGDEMGRGK
ncbi:unnamed protein product, partial [Prorocentrum cordatum]